MDLSNSKVYKKLRLRSEDLSKFRIFRKSTHHATSFFQSTNFLYHHEPFQNSYLPSANDQFTYKVLNMNVIGVVCQEEYTNRTPDDMTPDRTFYISTHSRLSKTEM